MYMYLYGQTFVCTGHVCMGHMLSTFKLTWECTLLESSSVGHWDQCGSNCTRPDAPLTFASLQFEVSAWPLLRVEETPSEKSQELCKPIGRASPYTILYYTVLYFIMLYYTILYYTILFYTILYYIILYYTILCCTILYYTILYYSILCYTILYCIILYYAVLYYTILYYTILYYTILYYIICPESLLTPRSEGPSRLDFTMFSVARSNRGTNEAHVQIQFVYMYVLHMCI